MTIRWTASVDDGTGEKDVERYAMYRRLSSVTTFDEPIGSLPAGASPTRSAIPTCRAARQWVYAVSALDCSPADVADDSSVAGYHSMRDDP